jgi:hypothetical protein
MNTEVEEKRARLLAELAALDESTAVQSVLARHETGLVKAATGGAKPFYLNRRRSAMFLEASYGAKISPDTLAKMAVSGTGPPFRRLGPHVVYEPSDLSSWAESRLSAKVHSTSGLPPADPFRKRPGRPRMNFRAPRSRSSTMDPEAA